MKRTPLKRRSKALSKRTALYRKLSREHLAHHPFCCCGNRATQIHHKNGRLGGWLTYVPFFHSCCTPCHRWIHANPAASEKLGWIVRIRAPFKQFIASLKP